MTMTKLQWAQHRDAPTVVEGEDAESQHLAHWEVTQSGLNLQPLSLGPHLQLKYLKPTIQETAPRTTGLTLAMGESSRKGSLQDALELKAGPTHPETQNMLKSKGINPSLCWCSHPEPLDRKLLCRALSTSGVDCFQGMLPRAQVGLACHSGALWCPVSAERQHAPAWCILGSEGIAFISVTSGYRRSPWTYPRVLFAPITSSFMATSTLHLV